MQVPRIFMNCPFILTLPNFSLHLQRLPFVFVLGLSTSPDYLRLTLKRSALKSVGSERFQAVGGEGHFGEIVEGVCLTMCSTCLIRTLKFLLVVL